MLEFFQDINSLLIKPYILIMLAFSLDMAIGDPLWLPHPVRAIGWLIAKTEIFLRSVINFISKFTNEKRKTEKFAGFLLVFFVTGFTFSLFYIVNIILIDLYSSPYTSYLSVILMIFLIATTISTRELLRDGCVILKALKDNSIETARDRLGHIVGRDTDSLDRKGIIRATIESLAENASDGIISPLFYFAVGGLPLAMTYKAVNTMDSMIGYKNERYKYFGWAAARLDDIANYIPARITGILIVISSAIVSRSLFTVHRSLKILLRDGRKHPSPNSGVPEAAIAGALGISLGGPSFYGNILVNKPFIGDKQQNPSDINNIDDIYLKASESALTMIKITSFLGLFMSIGMLHISASL